MHADDQPALTQGAVEQRPLRLQRQQRQHVVGRNPGGALDLRRVLNQVADPRSVIARSGYADEAGAQGFLWDVVLDV